jgi:hypothetical protein
MAINHLMLIAAYGVLLGDRFEGTLRLADIGPFLGDAVATALEANDLARAFGWLENGRNLTWKAISAQWQPPDAIDETHPDFAQTISSRAPEIMHCDQNNDYARSDTRIDTAAALATFDGGPVVFLNAGKIRCDAIILGCSPGELQHVRLGNLYHRVIGWQQELKGLLSRLGIRERLQARRRAEVGFDEDARFTKLLGELWESIVTPILEAIHKSYSDRVSNVSFALILLNNGLIFPGISIMAFCVFGGVLPGPSLPFPFTRPGYIRRAAPR